MIDTSQPDITHDVPALIEKLKSKEPGDKIGAMVWLGKLGADAQPAIPRLTEIAAKDKNPSIKKLAQDTISKIQGQ